MLKTIFYIFSGIFFTGIVLALLFPVPRNTTVAIVSTGCIVAGVISDVALAVCYVLKREAEQHPEHPDARHTRSYSSWRRRK